ncbi:hypothetical protein L7F22_001705, partial [Adiantum nelumboides]|nr:hypothetical protein [Adiantum nelumboides]
ERIVVVDKSQEERNALVGESRPQLDFLSPMVCTSGSQNTFRSIKKKKRKK